MGELAGLISRQYGIECTELALYRDWIGYVYFVRSDAGRYVFKLYRGFDTANALHSIGILRYLGGEGFPVPAILPTLDGQWYVIANTPQGESVGILYEYVDGTDPDRDAGIERIGEQTGWLHALMRRYPGKLIRRGREHYIDRYIALCREMGCRDDRIGELERYGRELWARMERLPQGFCHGDLHTGNMLETQSGRVFLLDFDVASLAYPVIDAAVMCDGSDYFHFDAAAYEGTKRLFERFCTGYGRHCALSDAEADAVFDFIAIRHYEIQATIVKCQGLQCISGEFMDEQYEWLMRWRDLCERNRRPAFTAGS